MPPSKGAKKPSSRGLIWDRAGGRTARAKAVVMALFISRVVRVLRLVGTIGLCAACMGFVAVAHAANGIVLAETPRVVADSAPAMLKPSDSARSASKKPVLAAAAATAIGPQPSAAEIVGNLLAPHASDPDVPLPQPGLAAVPPANEPSAGPRIFGRGEDGGGVLGIRIPIPATRGALIPTRDIVQAGQAAESTAGPLTRPLLRRGHSSGPKSRAALHLTSCGVYINLRSW
jgi:hypothetical protein